MIRNFKDKDKVDSHDCAFHCYRAGSKTLSALRGLLNQPVKLLGEASLFPETALLEFPFQLLGSLPKSRESGEIQDKDLGLAQCCCYDKIF